MKRTRLLVLVVLTTVLAGLAASASAAPTRSVVSSCSSAQSLGIAAPLTGPAAVLGQEQLSWTQFAVSRFNKQYRTSYKLLQGDTQLSASLSRTVVQQFVSNKSVYGIVGPSTSQAVVVGGTLMARAGLAGVSPSATRTSLTNGQYRTFFRVVPNDSIQAPQDANFIISNLHAKHVYVLDSQDSYSVPLADSIQAILKAKGVTVDRDSVPASQTDFSTIATKVGSDVSVVVFATQTPANAQSLSDQLRAAGKKAVVFGTDGAFSPDTFKPNSGYASVFAKYLALDPAAASIVNAYKAFSHGKSFGAFGPPSYVATWVLMSAMKKACGDGKISRFEVTALVRRTNLTSILGHVAFGPHGEPLPTKFWIYKITNGNYTLVA